MSTAADIAHIQHSLSQRRIYKDIHGNGITYDFARALLQHTEYQRMHHCPRCGAYANHGVSWHIIDHGADGVCCTRCEGVA